MEKKLESNGYILYYLHSIICDHMQFFLHFNFRFLLLPFFVVLIDYLINFICDFWKKRYCQGLHDDTTRDRGPFRFRKCDISSQCSRAKAFNWKSTTTTYSWKKNKTSISKNIMLLYLFLFYETMEEW